MAPKRVQSGPPRQVVATNRKARHDYSILDVYEAGVALLGLLIRRYDLIADPDYELQVAERLTLMPKGFELRLRRRQGVAPSRPGGRLH